MSHETTQYALTATDASNPCTSTLDVCKRQVQEPCHVRSTKQRQYVSIAFPYDVYAQEPPAYVDRLKKLYPHTRDSRIYMEEKTHTYYVDGKVYDWSVSK